MNRFNTRKRGLRSTIEEREIVSTCERRRHEVTTDKPCSAYNQQLHAFLLLMNAFKRE